MRHRILIAVLFSAFGIGISPAQAQTRDVQWVADHALSITGRRIELVGFLSRIDNYYFFSEGRRRPLGSRGPAQYWCSFSGSPAKLWFVRAETGPLPGGLSIPDDIDVGRKVVIRADFFGELRYGFNEESPFVPQDGEDFSRHELGPLKHVRILRAFADRCQGAPG